MLNKKILAAAIAVAFTSAASASVDLNGTVTSSADTIGTLTVATESFSSSDFDDGFLPIIIDGVSGTAGATDLDFDLGFSVGQGVSRFVRVDLTNAEFGDVPALTVAAGATAYVTTNFNAVLSQGGNGETFVVIEISDATADIPLDAQLTLATATVNATTSSTVTAQYRLYDDALDASNGSDATLSDTGAVDYIRFATGAEGEFTDANTVTSTVSSGFTEFSGEISATLANLASVDVADLVADNTITFESIPFAITDLVAATADLTITGDFSAGTFFLSVNADCSTSDVDADLNDDLDEAEFVLTDITTQEYNFCLSLADAAEVDGVTAGFDADEDQAQRGDYIAVVEGVADDSEFTDEAGTVQYDTTTIEVPFVTTFADYNQRVYIVNTSGEDALYTVTFVTEEGVTYTAGDAASGTADADEVTLILANELVEISGGNRIAAFIEIELADDDVSVATQIVNRSSGETDTIILN